MAGGFSATAYPSDIKLERVSKFGNKLLKSLNFESDSNLVVENGDKIEIGSSSNLTKNIVKIDGEVDRAGEYEWKEGIRLKDIVKNKFLLSEEIF